MPRVEMDEDDRHEDVLGTMDFAVTRDFSILPNNAKSNVIDRRTGHSPKVKRKLNIEDNVEPSDANLHEMSL